MKSWLHEEQVIWGVLALVFGYILYSFFMSSSGKEWFSPPPTCSWAPPTTAAIPSMGIRDFLSGYEYSTSTGAQAECSMDPSCTGVIGMTRTVNVSDGSARGYHTEARGYWKLSKSTTMVSNTDPNLQYIAKLSCSVPQSSVSSSSSTTCTFDSTGNSNSVPIGNTIGTQQKTLRNAQIACSALSNCEGVFLNPNDGFFYMSDSLTLSNSTGFVFYSKMGCPPPVGGSGLPTNMSGGASLTTSVSGGASLTTSVSGSSSGMSGDLSNVLSSIIPPAIGNVSAVSDPKPSVGNSNQWGMAGDSWVLKSSLVPCSCTTHTMGCARHAGGIQSSFAPGDLDGKIDYSVGGGGGIGRTGNAQLDNNFQYRTQPQRGIMRPFSQAFVNQGEPTGFLNSFGAFGW